jgi:hypothetical protein
MRKADFVVGVVGMFLASAGLTHPALAAPLASLGAVAEPRNSSAIAATRVGCSRARGYYYSQPPAAYYPPRYDPSVVYYGPSGIYRPYPPIVVYQYPVYAPYAAPWGYSRSYYDDYYYDRYRRW